MKLVTFLADARAQAGVLCADGGILAISSINPDLPDTVAEIAGLGPERLAQIDVAAKSRAATHRMDEVSLLVPIPNPTGLFCVGLNYKKHREEIGKPRAEFPTVFMRPGRSQVADGAPIVRPKVSETLDWEGELAVIIGKPGRNIAAKDAFDHVFGYSIYNDGSVREYQRHTTQFGMGKWFDDTGAFGPWIVTADAFGDPYAQHLQTTLNGKPVQDADIADMDHRIEDVIAYLSQGIELRPGDIILTGTPGGVGASLRPPVFMKQGDTIAVTVSGIGTLTNPIVDQA